MTPDAVKNITDIVIALGTALAAICAAIAVLFSKRTVGEMRSQLEEMRSQHEESVRSATRFHGESLAQSLEAIKSQTFLECLEIYLDIMTKQARAIQDNQMAYAYDMQRSLVDLLWFEFQLWKRGHINDEIFHAWLVTRKRSYNGDQPELKFEVDLLPNHLQRYTYVTKNRDPEGKMVILSYRRVWDYLVDSGYYPDGDKFVKFMREIHAKDGEDIMEILKSTPRS